MDSSPRPLRRFSRWKTSKCTFVLGGKKYGTGNKDQKANNVKDVQRKDSRSKFRSSPRSPRSKKFSLHINGLSKESANNETPHVNAICKAMADCSQDSKEVSLISNNEHTTHKECIGSTSPQALSVLSPNVSAAKDIQADSAPKKHCDIAGNPLETDKNSGLSSECQINQNEYRNELEANPDSPSIDKENSSTVAGVQDDTSLRPELQIAKRSVESHSNKSKDDDDDNDEDHMTGNCSRRQTLRDRSLLLPSSAVLNKKNYPFPTLSLKKRTIDRSSKKNTSRQRQLSTNTSLAHSGKKNKESGKKDAAQLEKDQAKLNKTSSRERINVSISHDENYHSDAKLLMNTSVDLIDINSTALPSDANKAGATPSLGYFKDNVSASLKTKNTKISPSESKDGKADNSKRKASNQRTQSRSSSKRKNRNSGIHECAIMNGSLKSSLKKGSGKERAVANLSKYVGKSSMQNRKNAKLSKRGSMSPSAAHGNASVSHNSSSNRSLRDRSSLATPEIQYPAKYMTASQINSLSDKAKRVLSIAPNFLKADNRSACHPPDRKKVNYRRDMEDGIKSSKTAGKENFKTKQRSLENSYQDPSNTLLEGSVRSHLYKNQFQKQKIRNKNNTIASKFPTSSLLPELGAKMEEKNVKSKNKSDSSKQTLSRQDDHFGRTKDKPRPSKCATATSIKEKKTARSLRRDIQRHCKIPQLSQESLCSTLPAPEQNDEVSMVILQESSKQIPKKQIPKDKVLQMKTVKARKSSLPKDMPVSSRNGNNMLNATAIGASKNLKRRRLFEDSTSESKKIKFSNDILYENGRDILLWSETGEARKGSSVTSLDVVFNDVIELEDRLKDSQTEYLQKRLIGKVMGRMKRSLKSQMYQLEIVKELESDIKKSRQSCNKVKAEITQLEEKDKRLQRKLMKTKESERKIVQEWMKDLRSLMASTRKK